MLYSERLGHRNGHDQTARLERAGRQSAFVLDQDFTAADFFRKRRHRHNRSHRFAQADDVFGFADGQQFAIAPKIGRSLCQYLLGQSLANAFEIVTHEQRLASARQVVHLVGLVALAGHRAFEMSDETGKIGCQIVIVLHAWDSFVSCIIVRRFGAADVRGTRQNAKVRNLPRS